MYFTSFKVIYFVVCSMFEMVSLKYLILVYSTLSWFSKCESKKDDCSFTPTKFYYWNKTKHSPEEYYLGLCTKRCNGSIEVTTQPISNFQCDFCSCLRPACEIYDICCPDASVPIYQIKAIAGDGFPGDKTKLYKSTTESNVPTKKVPRKRIDCLPKGIQFYFVALCSPEYKENQTIVALCETELDVSELTVDTYIKVMDNSTGVVYKNIYCAICNKVSQVTVL
ncbi:latrophilin-3 [Biomphalaria glabrata]